MNIEKIFLEDITKYGRSIITIGQSETGKTYLMLKILIYLLNNNIYDEYHLILPSFINEQNHSYDFLKQYDNVFIYTEYHDIFIQKILESCKNKKIFFCLDDGTGRLDFRNQDTIKRVITTSRHLNLTCWIIAHSSNGVFSKQVRSNIKYLFLTNYENEKSLKDDIFLEYISMAYGSNNFMKFKEEFLNVMKNNKYGQLLIARNMEINKGKQTIIDFNVCNWNIMTIKPIIKKKEKQKEEKKKEYKKSIFNGKFY